MLACVTGVNANMPRRLVGKNYNIREVHFLAATALGQICAAGL